MAASISPGTDDHKKPSSTNAIHVDLDSIRAFFPAAASELKSRVSLDTIRPLPMFMGVTDHAFCFSPQAFTPPVKKIDKSSIEKSKSRLKLNFAFFLSNYVLVASGVALVIALMHPGMLISIGLLWGLWGLHHFLISNEFILFGCNIGNLVSITHRSAFLTALTLLVVIWKCLVPTILALVVSALLILSHAIMRDPKHIDTSTRSRTDSDEEVESDTEFLVPKDLA